MGYDQYWLAVPELPQREWDMVAKDFAKVAAVLHRMGLRLAGPDGTGPAVINGEAIAFNGVRDCGHARRRHGGAVWPGPRATGIAPVDSRGRMGGAIGGSGRGGQRSVVRGPPFVEPVSARLCDGSCAAEPFVMERTMPDDEYTKVYGTVSPLSVNGVRDAVPRTWVGKYFQKCRTCYKPYDLAVCCCLLVAKRRFGSLVVVASDGVDRNWADVRALCQQVLGYGRGMRFGAGGRMLCAAGTRTPAAPDMSGRHVPVYSPDGDGMEFEAVGRAGEGIVFAASYGEDAAGDGGSGSGNTSGDVGGRPREAGPQ